MKIPTGMATVSPPAVPAAAQSLTLIGVVRLFWFAEMTASRGLHCASASVVEFAESGAPVSTLIVAAEASAGTMASIVRVASQAVDAFWEREMPLFRWGLPGFIRVPFVGAWRV